MGTTEDAQMEKKKPSVPQISSIATFGCTPQNIKSTKYKILKNKQKNPKQNM